MLDLPIPGKAIHLAAEEAAARVHQFEQEMASMQKACPHLVIYDQEAYPYWFRHCLACGKGLGLL